MRVVRTVGISMIVGLALSAPGSAAVEDLRATLHPQQVSSVRINLGPWGAQLGFETTVSGSDVRVEALTDLIREAQPGTGHKCANSGAIRFRMQDGSVVGVGLLPSHAEGRFDLRLYDGDRFVAVYSVDRIALLAALEDLGVPVNDPAFRE